MKNKIVLATILLCSLALALTTSWLQVSAQGPTNTHPAAAIYLDNQWRFIPPSTSLWYLFDYSGDRSLVELVLVDGVTNRLAFNVYTPEQVSPPDYTNPIGRGSTPQVNCDSVKCPANDLVWKGSFTGPGTFYVQIVNPNADSRSFLMRISGSGVTLRQPTATLTATRPAATATPDAFQTAVAAVVATLQATHTPQITPSPTVTVTAAPNAMQTVVAGAVATLLVPVTPSATPTATPNAMQTMAAAAAATLQAAATPVITPTATLTGTLQPAATPDAMQTIVAAVVATVRAPAAPAPVTAAGPSPTPTVINSHPTTALYVDSRWRWILGNSDLWFRFDYAGDRSAVSIRLPDGFKNHLEFRIYTQEQALRFDKGGTYVGESSPQWVSCGTGKCPSDDLFWSGGFAERGTFYIRVSNLDQPARLFQLQISGTGVTLGP